MIRPGPLPGHNLMSAGKPYKVRDGREGPLHVVADGPGGFALCECWVTSGWLSSDEKRRAWHDRHVRSKERGLSAVVVVQRQHQGDAQDRERGGSDGEAVKESAHLFLRWRGCPWGHHAQASAAFPTPAGQ